MRRCAACDVIAAVKGGDSESRSVADIDLADLCFPCWRGFDELIQCRDRGLVESFWVYFELPF